MVIIFISLCTVGAYHFQCGQCNQELIAIVVYLDPFIAIQLVLITFKVVKLARNLRVVICLLRVPPGLSINNCNIVESGVKRLNHN